MEYLFMLFQFIGGLVCFIAVFFVLLYFYND